VAKNGHICSEGSVKIYDQKTERHTLAISEMKMLRMMYCSAKENGMWRICNNQELFDLYREPDIISEIRKG
jgi:hypothetical protein